MCRNSGASDEEVIPRRTAPGWPPSPPSAIPWCGTIITPLLGWELVLVSINVRKHRRCYYTDNQRDLLQEVRQWSCCSRVMSLRTMLVLINGTYVEISLDSLTQAGIIFIMGVAVIITNVLVIATLLNFRGKQKNYTEFPEIKKLNLRFKKIENFWKNFLEISRHFHVWRIS